LNVKAATTRLRVEPHRYHIDRGWADRLQRAYSLNQGNASFIWDGKCNDGTQWPNGTYTLTATYRTRRAMDVAIPTEVQGIVVQSTLPPSPALLLDRRQDLHDRPDQAGHSGHRELRRRFPPPPLTPSPDPFSRVRRPRDGGLEGIFKEIRIEALG